MTIVIAAWHSVSPRNALKTLPSRTTRCPCIQYHDEGGALDRSPSSAFPPQRETTQLATYHKNDLLIEMNLNWKPWHLLFLRKFV